MGFKGVYYIHLFLKEIDLLFTLCTAFFSGALMSETYHLFKHYFYYLKKMFKGF